MRSGTTAASTPASGPSSRRATISTSPGKAGDLLNVEAVAADPDARVAVRAVPYHGSCDVYDVECLRGLPWGRACHLGPILPSAAWTATLPKDGWYRLWIESSFAPSGTDHHLEVQVAGGAGNVFRHGSTVTHVGVSLVSCPSPISPES